jgi:hypothetical protein
MAAPDYGTYGQRWYTWFQQHPDAYRAAVAQGMPGTAATYDAFGQAVGQFFQTRSDLHQQMLSWGSQPSLGWGGQPPQSSGQAPSVDDMDDDDFLTWGKAKGWVQSMTEENQRLRQELQQGQQTIYELMRISTELNDLDRDAHHQHTGYQSAVDRQKIAEYMLQNHVNDVKQAWEQMQAPQREQQGYAKGRADLEAEMRQRGRHLPWTESHSRDRSDGSRSQYPPQSEERKSEILDRISARLGIPRDDQPPPSLSRPTFDSPSPSSASSPSSRPASQESPGPTTDGQSAA